MRILRGEDLKPCNSLSLLARASALVNIHDSRDLPRACKWARERGLDVVALGQGSNVVLAGDLEALVLRLQTRGMEILEDRGDTVLLRVAAGEDWHGLVQWTLQHGFHGLENLALIPGTAGAAPIQNIGAYGVELESFVERVHALEISSGDSLSLDAAECRFSYRDSIFKGELRDRTLITAIELRLPRQSAVNISYPALEDYFRDRDGRDVTPGDVFAAVVDIRSAKLPDPATFPNAGSFFKNPVVTPERARELASAFPGMPQFPQGDGVKLPAAWLIEHCGWKGYRDQGIGVHPQHALVLVNYGGDSGEQLLALADRIAASVRDSFVIELEIEPRVYGRRQ